MWCYDIKNPLPKHYPPLLLLQGFQKPGNCMSCINTSKSNFCPVRVTASHKDNIRLLDNCANKTREGDFMKVKLFNVYKRLLLRELLGAHCLWDIVHGSQ